MRRLLILWLALLAAAALAAPPLVVATGAPGGVYRLYGRGLADLLDLRARETAGAVENLKLIRSGEAQLAFATVDSAYDAVRGTGAYVDGGPVPVRTVAVLYPSLLHVVTLARGPLRTLSDLNGRRVSLGSPGSSSQIATGRLLRAAGIAVIPSFLGVQDAARALKSGEVEAFFWISGLPCEGILALGEPIRLLDATAHLPALVGKYGPVYTSLSLPGGVYPGCPQDTPAIALNNILAAHQDLPAETVYDLLSRLFARLDEVRRLHPEAARLSRASASQGSSIEFHPGATRFFNESGSALPASPPRPGPGR